MTGQAGDGEGTQARERDLDRFLTFVDAIVAIAITLLVLPLVELGADLHGSVPELTDGSPPPRATSALVNTGLLLLALLISLVVPHASYYPMLLLALDGVVLRLIRHTPAAEATHDDEPDRLVP